MTRDTVICFRTSEELRKALEKISEADRRSLSSVIENILYDYVGHKGSKGLRGEKRRHSRKKVSAPALVSGVDGAVHAAMVNDISLGGLHISVLDGFQCEMRDDAKMSIVFTLPQSERPLSVQCLPRHVRENGQTAIGASFIDTDFQSYQALQNFLME